MHITEEKYKDAQHQIKDLKKNIQMMEDNKTPHKLTSHEQIIKRLQKELIDKENQVTELESATSSLDDKVKLLEDKLNYSLKQLKTVMNDNVELSERIEMQKAEIEECSVLNKGLSTNNKELDEIIKDLRSQLNKSGHDLSFDLLNGSSSENSQSGNFSFAMPENLANAVVDVRLLDQQKQNQALTHQIERVRSELHLFKAEHVGLLKSIMKLEENATQTAMGFDVDDISVELRELFTIFAEQTQRYITELAEQKLHFDKLNEAQNILQLKFDDVFAERNKLKDDIMAREQQLALTTTENENLVRRIEQSGKLLDEERVQRQNVESTLKATMRELEDNLTESKKETARKCIEITEKGTQIEKLQCDLNARQIQLQTLDHDLKLMENRVKDALTITERQNENIADLQKQKESLLLEIVEVKKQAQSLHEHQDSAARELASCKIDYNSLLNEKQSLDEKHDQLLKQSVQRDSLLKEVQEQLEIVNQAFLEKEKECDVIRVQLDAAKQQLKESECAQQPLMQKITEFESIQENLNEAIKRLESEKLEIRDKNQLLKSELNAEKSNSSDSKQVNTIRVYCLTQITN